MHSGILKKPYIIIFFVNMTILLEYNFCIDIACWQCRVKAIASYLHVWETSLSIYVNHGFKLYGQYTWERLT